MPRTRNDRPAAHLPEQGRTAGGPTSPAAARPGGTDGRDAAGAAEAVDPAEGRSLVARRALREIVRDAVLGSYGVTGLAAPTRLAWLRGRIGLGNGAIKVALRPDVSAQVWLEVAYGLPVAEVARQVDSAIRYELERAVGREVGSITIHVQGLRGRPFTTPPGGIGPAGVDGGSGPARGDGASDAADLAGAGSDGAPRLDGTSGPAADPGHDGAGTRDRAAGTPPGAGDDRGVVDPPG